MLLKVEPTTLRVSLPLGPMHTSQGTTSTRSPRRAALRGASGAAPPDGSRGARVLLREYSAVRTHRDVCEGRADDADVAGGAV
jgi:hypothetical protein